MRFAARINSFKQQYKYIEKIIDVMASIDGLTDVEINLPEHTDGLDHKELAKNIRDSGLNFSGGALRFRDDFKAGEFGEKNNRLIAIDLAKRTIDIVSDMGGDTLTIWLAYDGYDYSFQIDYSAYWHKVITAFQDIADYNRNMRISIEFKPWEPRTFSIMPNTGMTLHAIDLIERDNVGMTLDYCHSLMAGENPAMSLALAGLQNRIFGIHLNDGNGFTDDGHIFGADNVIKALEFMYYMRQQEYNGLIYFDTFPVHEDPKVEVALNIQLFKAYQKKLDQIGFEQIKINLQNQKKLFGQKFVLDNIL